MVSGLRHYPKAKLPLDVDLTTSPQKSGLAWLELTLCKVLGDFRVTAQAVLKVSETGKASLHAKNSFLFVFISLVYYESSALS